MTTEEEIKNLISSNNICLFMKGTPENPQCGFSMAVSNILKHLGVKFLGVNVLENQTLREKIKIAISETIGNADVDVTGSESKYTVKVITDDFIGKSIIQRHKMIYASLNKYIQTGEIHALTIESLTKDESK